MRLTVQLTTQRRCTDKFSSCALHAAPIATAPLRRMSVRSFCRHTEPSPPFLSPCAGHVSPMQCMAIKGGHPIASHLHQLPCLPLVSHHHRARLYFLPHHRCHLEPCHGMLSECAPGRARCAVRARRADGAVPCGPASLALGRAILGLFSVVVGPWQAERALCLWATLRFWPGGHLKLESSFSIFLRFQFEFKL
jgi:hypothetical protein